MSGHELVAIRQGVETSCVMTAETNMGSNDKCRVESI